MSLPPEIRELDVPVDARLANEIEMAVREVTALDVEHGEVLDSLAALLLRTESVASSKIERIEADIDDYARALHGSRANPSATSMVAATAALDTMIGEVGLTGTIDRSTLTDAHATLMADDEDRADRGRFRDVQSWIGGSDHSPRNALYVPPPPELVTELLDDLMAFVGRDDVPALVQAAIAHAQFESIHPFTDGNGRIGRALINAVMRRRGITTKVVVPLASALVAHRDRYFDQLTAYRQGDPGPLLRSFVRSCAVAASESRRTAATLAGIPAEWSDVVGRVRSGSATESLLRLLPSRPIFSTEDVVDAIGASQSSTYTAVGRLAEVGVVRPLTERKRDQVWGATRILEELDDLGARIAAAAR